VAGAEELLQALDGQRLDDVDVLAAAVVKFSLAMSSMCSSWRRFSAAIAAQTSGSAPASWEAAKVAEAEVMVWQSSSWG
jgi:hypothetical protein